MVCWKCGEKMLEEDNYCPMCGSEALKRLYERRKGEVFIAEVDSRAQKLERYLSSSWSARCPFAINNNNQLGICYFNGYLYYFNRRNLCVSREDGSERRILAKEILNKDCRGIFGQYALFVNDAGIFVYHFDHESADVILKMLDFDGKQKNQYVIDLSCSTSPSYPCIYGENLYYYSYPVTEPRKDQIRRLNVRTGEDTLLTGYSACNLYASSDMLFYVGRNFENQDSDIGLYKFDLAEGKEELFDRFQKWSDYFMIDILRGVYWQEFRDSSEDDHAYLIPRLLSNRELAPHMPIWKLHPDFGSYGCVYFDGQYLFSFGEGSDFCSYNHLGQRREWQLPEDTWVQNLYVANGKLYAQLLSDINEDYMSPHSIFQYEASFEPMGKLRDGWFDDPIEEPEFPRFDTAPDDVFPTLSQEELDAILQSSASFDMQDEPDAETVEGQQTAAAGSLPTPTLSASKVLTETDINYGIMTLGARFDVGFGRTATLIINGHSYPVKMHNSVKGRIGGLKAAYRAESIAEGTEVHAEYYEDAQEIRVTL